MLVTWTRLSAGCASALGVLAVAAGIAVPAAAQAQTACSEPVDVQTTEDSCGTLVSVSVTGDAYGVDCSRERPTDWGGYERGDPVSCITVSVAGNTRNEGDCGGDLSCIAVSGGGDATNTADIEFSYARN